jgi:hypothetical protein
MRVVRLARAVGKVKCCADFGHLSLLSKQRRAGQNRVNRPLRPGVNVFFAFGLNDSYQMGRSPELNRTMT